MTKKEVKAKKEREVPKKDRYIEGVGRRKTAVARVRIYPAVKKESKNNILVNDKSFEEYFPTKKNQGVVVAPFEKSKLTGTKTTVKVKGGGISAQAEAIRLGASRALIKFDEGLRPPLKALGYLKRDPRMVERKKPGLRKARRPQQWRKR